MVSDSRRDASWQSSVAEGAAETLAIRYRRVRGFSETLCRPLAVEDFVVQSMADACPTKWHLAHTTWFFETFVLRVGIPLTALFTPSMAIYSTRITRR